MWCVWERRMPACCPPASPETLQHGNLHGKLVHLQDILTYLWECFRNPLHIHPTTHLSVTAGNFLQGIPNRLISIFPILCPFLSCFGQERTETLSFLFFFSPSLFLNGCKHTFSSQLCFLNPLNWCCFCAWLWVYCVVPCSPHGL